ncbi:hypothetical protein [Rheinheimera pleomorphica]|uniref:hypothetical protein n=1 Tax=Rheinheimera pleomorphica TaxID=2703963 RepID=UPI0014246F48|nr:hypothetical protein [Rheinheimera pleomorphica]
MNDALQLLQQVASQLQQEGKTPSLALFRARLAGRIAPQQLFAAYQHWRNNPVYAEMATTPSLPPDKPQPDQAQHDDINHRLQRIEAKLDLLLNKLER